LYEPRPNADLVRDGIAGDTLGLFSGESLADGWTSGEVLPAHIHLFLENLWEFADGDTEIYREEVRRTYLHELGHYLGLDEDELDQRGLQ
jgi:predicted Zn-dependent protease with MMP-like domain